MPKIPKSLYPLGKSPLTPLVPSHGLQMLIAKIKEELKNRGSGGFVGLQRRFKIMDDDNSKSLSMPEFKKAMKEMKIDITEADLRQLFDHFDTDLSGSIDFEEFIQGIRDPMVERRLKLVKMAFQILDKDGSGEVDGNEVASMYDASQHPEVLSRRKTPQQVLKEFLENFEVGGVKDGILTKGEFINYYTNISASIDNDDYFELMIRNAWHLNDGSGPSSINMRVLVTDNNGNERSVQIENDLGLKPDDLNGIYNRLTKQGVKDIMAINGKVLKVVNVNGVEVITSQGSTSQLQSQMNEAATGKTPALTVSRNRSSGTTTATSTTSPSKNQGTEPWLPRIVSGKLMKEPPQKKNASQLNALKTVQSISTGTEDDIVCNTLLDVLRTQLLAKGTAGIIELQRKFIEMDTDNSKSLDKKEFKLALLSNKLTFSESQLTTLFNYFDLDRSGTIDYNELLNGLRGQLGARLLAIINEVFDKLDPQGLNTIEPQFMLTQFDPTRHPDALSGLRTPQQVLQEFLDTFDVGGQQVGKITRDEFVTYYTNISAAINDDMLFEDIVRKTWNLPAGEKFRRSLGVQQDPDGNKVIKNNNLHLRFQQQVAGNEPMSESVVLDELRVIQTQAVTSFNLGNYQEAEKKFTEAKAVVQMMYPPGHPECVKADKSLQMVQTKARSAKK